MMKNFAFQEFANSLFSVKKFKLGEDKDILSEIRIIFTI